MSENKVGTGLDKNVAGALAYLLGFVTGIILLLIEKDREFVRFHAAQSIVVFVGLFILNIVLGIIGSALAFSGMGLGFISMIFGLLSMLIWLITFILWIFLMYMAYQGKKPRIPVAAEIADNLV